MAEDSKLENFKKATLVLSQAAYVPNGVVEVHDADYNAMKSICSMIEQASANVGAKSVSSSTAYSQIVEANKISVFIATDEVGKVMKKLHELFKEPTNAEVLEKEKASKLLNYIKTLRASDQSSSIAPIALKYKGNASISISPDFIGPLPEEEKISNKKIVKAA